MIRTYHFSLGASALTALTVLVAGCTSAAPTPTAAPAAKPTTAPAAAPTTAPAAAPVNVSIMVGGLDKQIYMTATLAKQLGYYEAEGLNIQLVDEPSGQSAEDALLVGEVQVAFGSYDHPIDLAGLNKQVVNVFQALIAPGEAEVVSTKSADMVKSPADFKDKNLGVTSIGSGTHTLSQFLSVKNGVDPTTVHFIPSGAGNTFIASMQQGKIDAGMTTEPTISRIVSSGVGKVLVDLRTPESTRAALGGDYPFTNFFVTADWMNKNKPTVQKLVNAWVKTHKWITSHTPGEVADKMPEDYYAGDKNLYVTALTNEFGMYSPDGKMPKGGPEFVLSVLQQFDDNVRGKQIDLSKTYTTEFVDKAS
jgi:NitT/TauT family transport system substrate-binding protein